MSELFLSHLIYFIAVIDPVGTVPVFLAVTKGFGRADLVKTAFKAIILSSVVLLFFVVAGEFILSGMNVPLPAFQIAGGIVLLLFALSMIFGESKPEEELRLAKSASDTAIYPLAIPSIAGPGAMLAAVLLTENSKYSIAQQSVTVAAMVCVLLLTLVALLLAGPIHRIIGQSGASIISRVMGILLTSVAVSNMIEGIKLSFNI